MRLTATGKTVNGWDFGEEMAPEFTGPTYGYDETAYLPNGVNAYVTDDVNATGAHRPIWAKVIGVDYGGNVHRVRVAADGDNTQGVAAPLRGLPLLARGEELIGWLRV